MTNQAGLGFRNKSEGGEGVFFIEYFPRQTLLFLLSHLKDVSQFSQENQMTPKNLGLLIGPNISWNFHQKRSDMADMIMKQNKIITHMIDNIEIIKEN